MIARYVGESGIGVGEPVELPVEPSRAADFFVRAEQLLREHYGHRIGFSIRKDLFWPKDGWVQHQLNMYLGSMAGFELSYQQAPGAHFGKLALRSFGELEHKAQAYIAMFGVGIAACSFLFLLIDGFNWDRFTVLHSRFYVGAHFSFGALILNAFIPAVLVGMIAGALAWPLSWLARPLCRRANRELQLDTPEQLLRRLQDVQL